MSLEEVFRLAPIMEDQTEDILLSAAPTVKMAPQSANQMGPRSAYQKPPTNPTNVVKAI